MARTAAAADISAALLGAGKLEDREFRRLAEFIEGELGIKMPESKRVMLESRLQKRLRALGIGGFREYVDYVFGDEGRERELVNMIDVVTTNKTDFFREADHFDFLLRRLLPYEHLERGAGADVPMKFWSAGCSTGEEPYTLAMVLEEFRADHPSFKWSITATDISTRVLDKAREAVYDEEKADPIPLELKRKYLLRSKDRERREVRVRPELRRSIRFARLNLMEPGWAVERDFDVVFCRNVIIYFDHATQERLLGSFRRHIRPGGYLFLGHSETLTGMRLEFKSVAPTIYRAAGTGEG